MMTPIQKSWLGRGSVALGVAVLAIYAWQRFAPQSNEDNVARGNGRIEAVEIDVASRSAGRVKEIRVAEGEFVKAGQVVAVIDTEVLDAQRRQAEAQTQQAVSSVATARSVLAQRESDKAAAQALVAQREVELGAARTQLKRTMALAEKGFVSPQAVDDDRTKAESAQAAVAVARAQVAAAGAATASARSQIAGAQSSTEAAKANVEKIQADVDDTLLKAPRDGRVQYRVAQPGEVVAAGGRVLNLIDLSDVYMTFFLPTAQAGRLAVGAETRIVLDAAPQFVIPARISFVASEAQFTPKTVETASEREKLMFRVKAQVPPEVLRRYTEKVKTGLPGVAYVRLDPTAPWPERLQVKMPP